MSGFRSNLRGGRAGFGATWEDGERVRRVTATGGRGDGLSQVRGRVGTLAHVSTGTAGGVI